MGPRLAEAGGQIWEAQVGLKVLEALRMLDSYTYIEWLIHSSYIVHRLNVQQYQHREVRLLPVLLPLT